MKRLLLAGLTGVLLAGCVQDPYGADPYEAGYPPYPQQAGPPPYPVPPYPAPAYPSPALPSSAYPDPNRPPPPGCYIASSRDWRAWVNAMPGPGARPRLMVTGTVVTPTGGNRVGFEPQLQIRRAYPAQAFATLSVEGLGNIATQALTSHEVRWEWPISQPIGTLTIRCGDQTLAVISPVETAR